MTPAQLEQRLSQNAASPVFARLADEYLAQGKIAEARALCISGLEHFPSYPTAYLVLSKCLEANENFSAAREVIGLARKILPSLPLFRELEVSYTARLSPDEAALLATETIPAESEIVESPVAETEIVDSPVAQVESVESPVAEEENISGYIPETNVVESPVAEPEVLESSVADVEIPAIELPAETPLEEIAPLSDESADPFGPIPELTIDDLDLPEPSVEPSPEALPAIQPEPSPEAETEEARAADDGGVGMSAFFENREPPRADESVIERSAPDLTVSNPEPVAEKTATTPLPPLKIEHKPLSLTPEAEDDGELSESASFEAGGRIVSRTLAEIYAIQGAYAEAILTFNLLMQERPEFRKDCEARIRDLEAKMQSKPLS